MAIVRTVSLISELCSYELLIMPNDQDNIINLLM